MATNERAGTLHVITREIGMPKRDLPIRECTPGMLLAETLCSESGAVMLPEKTPLSASHLDRLAAQGIARLRVQVPAECMAAVEARCEALYASCLESVGGLFNPVASGKSLPADQVLRTADTVRESALAGSDVHLRPQSPNLTSSGRLQTHSLNTAMLAAFLHQWMGHSAASLPVTIQAALLHDIGKTRLGRNLLELPGELTPHEIKAWRRHPRLGWEIVHACRGMEPLVEAIVATHHELPDGSGYPMGLTAANIHPLTRVVAVADRFDNLTAGTARERSVSPFRAFEMLEEEARQGFHPQEVHCLLAQVPGLYVGDRFFLSNGDIGEVLHIHPERKSRPLMKASGRFLDLAAEPGILIEAMV